MSYDNACKYLAEQYPADFVRWLLGVEVQQIEVLKTELTLEPIRADSVTFLQAANQILHIEFQTLAKSNPALNFRMLDYSVRLKRQYRCPVVQVLIFLQETTNEMAFTEEYRDNTTIHQYQVVRLWEQDSTLFLVNPALLPLASLTRTDSPQSLLAQVAEQVATIPDREERQNIAGCVEILAGLRFDKDFVRQFLREDIMRESVIYQDIVQKEAFKLISRLLKRRFGDIDGSLVEQVRNLSAEQLEDLGEALLDFSEVADLVAWLEQQERD
ncbi:Rpn family recombination-promoting nuclease/putative transposase [Nostoc sp. C110]|uniref:Rpn family recombination-promoting nuclease/putative transposase n=1 Tax=Nostoc sp. C110 TaxID=3349876 RepID=UPI00370D8CCD